MKLGILSLACLLLALYDIRATELYGHERELNPLVRRLIQKWGPRQGAVVGIGVPTLLWILACVGFDSPTVLALYTGSRFTLAKFQHYTLRLKGYKF
jgi:hypothetical protein